MNVLVTIVLIAGVAMWAAAVYARLVRLRQQVTDAWKLLQADQSKTAAQNVYNARVQSYNAALDKFPAYLIAPLAGLKPANHYKSAI